MDVTTPTALTIAGSDPTGGAGLQLDLQVFALHGVHGMAVPTALTIQTTKGVKRTSPVFPSVVAEQITALVADIRPAALKLGMLATDDIVLAVANALARWDVPRVVDPVFRASDGTFLLEQRALGNLVERLIHGAALVTPNVPEAEALTGETNPERAAPIFLEMGAQAVLVKGGHAAGSPDDYLATRAGAKLWLRGQRSEVGPVHGTGCALSAAITARLARGETLESAVRGAKDYVARAIAASFAPGHGARILGLTSDPG
ncbi:MAG TPA: bifunctional hydroxymethylpyrimidine kinase/phosphomethylpyrimidine kinase [Myxococcota bacterium]|nr:bifunctional hydroxymethylpyrimidine kinase/phosphomethylpyrimidine kinase [Myxococcota bacterium]